MPKDLQFLILSKQTLSNYDLYSAAVPKVLAIFCHEHYKDIPQTQVFSWQDEKVSPIQIFPDMLKTKQQTHWHDRCESLRLKSLSVTCGRLPQ